MKPPAPATVHRALLARFGRQGWWPLTPRGKTRPLYRAGRGAPRTERGRFEIAVGAILTQNTAWSNVEKALAALHAGGEITPQRLLTTPQGRLARAIKSSGYFTQKAIKLKDLARAVSAHGGLGRWLRGPLAKVRAELLAVRGIGPETADSILLYAGGRPVFVVDAYTRRIFNRLGSVATEDYETLRAWLEANLPADPSLFNEYHALIVALGKDVCKPTPCCELCPLREMCKGAR